MSWDNKVVWSEGLFLRPQHLQQADRYVEKLVRGSFKPLRGFGWGFTELRLNAELLALGKIAIERASGIMEDGTPFTIPGDADPPAPFSPPAALRDSLIHLALPVWQPGVIEADERRDTDVVARWYVDEQTVIDATAGERGQAELEIGRLRFRLLSDEADRAGFVSMPVARLIELRADSAAILDQGFVAPVLDCAASGVLASFISEIQGLLHHRGEALAARLGQPSAGGVAEISDYLLLQLANRYESLFAHLATASTVHPEAFFSHAVQLAADIATYARPEKRPPAFPTYRHDQLDATFAPVMRSIRASLGYVLRPTAVPIPLSAQRYGVFTAQAGDTALFSEAVFVLAVKAEIAAERLRREFPSQIKIGPLERIRELVNVALPGIGVSPLPVAPRQIPFHVGWTYFEVDGSSPMWKGMEQSAALALHVAGDFPGLEMALWAIRGR